MLVVVHVEGDSMAPSLAPGDRVLAVRRTDWRGLWRGEVVVCRRPGGRESDPYLIKRVVAVAGDPVPARCSSVDGDGHEGAVLGSGRLWIQGDAERSFDSRSFGSVAETEVVARVVARLTLPTGRAARTLAPREADGGTSVVPDWQWS